MEMEAIEWNLGQLQQYVWKGLGPRKHLVGRSAVDKAIGECVSRWPWSYDTAVMPTVESPSVKELSDTVTAALQGYEGRDKKYGVIWTLLLSAVVSQLVRLLVDWWIKRRENRLAFNCMKVQQFAQSYSLSYPN